MTVLLNALSSKRWGGVPTPQQSPVTPGGLVPGIGVADEQVRADAGGASADQLGAPKQTFSGSIAQSSRFDESPPLLCAWLHW